MKLKLIIILLLQFSVSFLFAQEKIVFKEPLKVTVKEKINTNVKKDDVLTLTGIGFTFESTGYAELSIFATESGGNSITFDAKKTSRLEFINIDNSSKVWCKNLIQSGLYELFLEKGYQPDLRNELIDESSNYLNSIKEHIGFYEDKYFEDYLYTIANKIYSGFSNDKRATDINVKILNDPKPNAFSLPNGYVLISTGLLSQIQSEDELVAVLAHEIAHFVLDHHIQNILKEIDRKKKAEFWSAFATIAAATTEAYIASNNQYYIPGALTNNIAIASSIISQDIIKRLGIEYNQGQETQADLVAQEILSVLKYDKSAMSMALLRLKKYGDITGNLNAMTGGDSHPDIDTRLNSLGSMPNDSLFTQPAYIKKVSFISSDNAWLELWELNHLQIAYVIADKNIINKVATESDFIVKAVAKRRLLNTKESNEEALNLLNKAKTLNVTPYILTDKELGITYLRLDNKIEAKKSFHLYLISLNELKERNEIKEIKNYNYQIESEIIWTKKMIFKVDNL